MWTDILILIALPIMVILWIVMGLFLLAGMAMVADALAELEQRRGVSAFVLAVLFLFALCFGLMMWGVYR